MSTEVFEYTVEKAKEELEKRPGRKNIAMISLALMLFFAPVFFFFSQENNVYQTAYAPLLVGWLMITVWIGHVVSSAMFISRSVELELSLEIANAILALTREKESNE